MDQTITLTLAGFAPDVVTTYTDVPVEWLNLLSTTAHLNSGTPYKAYLPRIVGGTSGLLDMRPSTEVDAVWPLGRLSAYSATIPPGGRFVFTFTTPGDYDFYASELPALTGRVTVLARPDLDLHSVVVSPMPVAVNGTAVISAVIANLGPGPAEPFSVTWRATPLWPLPQVELYGGMWSVAGLSAGDSIVLTATQVVTQAGALNVVVNADVGEILPETSEANNTGQAEMGVLGTIDYCGDITGDATWAYAVFVPTCNITVQGNATLTLRSGVVVKPMGGVGIYINGRLNGVGDSITPVVLTSYMDDAYGGDTNNDGSGSTPVPGSWTVINIASTGMANIDYARIRYGGAGQTIVGNAGGTLYLAHSTIESGAGTGIQVASGSTLTVQDSIIQ
ncbi:MAG TPA: CARDB domain-containing protein, partial [Thermoflexales bacterium]|nr:CARDB domain-containing protein [Thermoflexales bacterium]